MTKTNEVEDEAILAVLDIMNIHETEEINDLTERERKIISIASEAAAKCALRIAYKNIEEHFYDDRPIKKAPLSNRWVDSP